MQLFSSLWDPGDLEVEAHAGSAMLLIPLIDDIGRTQTKAAGLAFCYIKLLRCLIMYFYHTIKGENIHHFSPLMVFNLEQHW